MAISPSESEHPMARICQEWLRKIEVARKKKWEVFGQYAQECAQFYDGAHNWMWKDEYAAGAGGFLDKQNESYLPRFRVQINKAFEAVALFGPALMHKYPQVTVTPVFPPIMPPETFGLDMQDEQAVMLYQQYAMSEQLNQSNRSTNAALLEHYANWLQIETCKKDHARRAITEAIIKGLGVLRTELHTPRGSRISYPRSRFISCDDVVKDPDADYAEDVTWVAYRGLYPLNRLAEKYGLVEDQLRGHMQSFESQSTVQGRREGKSGKSKQDAATYDLLECWEVYSTNGFGHRLSSTDKRSLKGKVDFDFLGDHCYLALCKGIPFPLNFPSWALAEEEQQQFDRVHWPIPFYADGGWPHTELHFYDKLNCVWPLSLLKPAIGELRFANWIMSFLADKAAASCTTYLGVAKAAGMEIQNQLQTGNAPYKVIEIAEIFGKSVKDVVSFLQAPEFQQHIFSMLAQVLELIDRRTGLTELVYGLTSSQIRSATEAGVRDQNLSIRPDDMAERTEEFYSQTVMKEIETAVWALEGEDVRGVLGDAGASVFEERIQQVEFDSIIRDYNYRIQAGSARKPNKNVRLRSLTEWGQVALPTLQQFATQGIVGPWNAYVQEVAKAMDFDAGPFLVELPPPEQQGPSPEEVEAQAKMAELEMKMQENVMSLTHDQESHEQELEQDEEKHEQEMEQAREKAKIDAQAAKARASAARRPTGGRKS